MERFERFRFSVPAVPLRRGFLRVSVQFNGEDGSGSGFPKILLRLFFRNNLTKLKITLEVKNNPKRLFLTLF